MRVFDFDSYKKFVNARIGSMPKKGRGQFRKISLALRMHSTLVSQVFRGDKQLTLEQACALADFFGMTDLETEFFVTLVEKEKAGSVALKQVFSRRLTSLRAQSTQISSRLPKAKALKEEDKATFYSQWYYSAVRLLTSIPQFQTRDAIALHLGLSPKIVGKVLEFLLAVGLCEEKRGRLHIGPSRTHTPADSPLAHRHHVNWRMKTMERFSALGAEELVFTSPMTLAEKDVPEIREEISALIEKVSRRIEPSPSEVMACLNIDWVKILPR
jgi:uncharacterized protein (TIGR02147 family)